MNISGSKTVSLIITVALLTILSLGVSVANAQVPKEKLHSNLKVGFVGEDSDDFLKMGMVKSNYDFIEEDVLFRVQQGQIDVVLVCGDYKLTTEEVNIVRDFVKNGGGLIVVDKIEYCRYYNHAVGEYTATASVIDLLGKVGLEVSESWGGDYIEGVISRDTNFLLEHPITKHVEKLHYWRSDEAYFRGVSGENAENIIVYPSSMVATSAGRGRVVVAPEYILDYSELSHPRITVNMIEWLAGYTPLDYEPSVTSLIGQLRERVNKLEGIENQLDTKNQEISDLQDEISELESQLSQKDDTISSLQDNIADLQDQISSLEETLQQKNERIATLEDKSMTIEVVIESKDGDFNAGESATAEATRDGEPVSGVEIECDGDSVTTGDDGTVTIQLEESGEQQLVVSYKDASTTETIEVEKAEQGGEPSEGEGGQTGETGTELPLMWIGFIIVVVIIAGVAFLAGKKS